MLQRVKRSTEVGKVHPPTRFQQISWVGRDSLGLSWKVFRYRPSKNQTENCVDDTS